MASTTEPKVPVEKPDPEAAERPSARGGQRPGFSPGGAEDEGAGDLPEGGPVEDPELGAGRATGGSELSSAKGIKG